MCLKQLYRNKICYNRNNTNEGEDEMDQHFYQFAMTFRDPHKRDSLTQFANRLEEDNGFPRNDSDYYQLADYLELSGEYSSHMADFDEMYQLFQERKEQANKITMKSEDLT